MKNCGKRFHVQVANKDFLHDIVKIIGPKNNPSEQVQEKVLSLIQVGNFLHVQVFLSETVVGTSLSVKSFPGPGQ